MNFDTSCERVGSVSFVYNRVFWIIPKFYDLKPSLWFRSAPFSLLGATWYFQICHIGCIYHTKGWLKIGVKQLSKSYTLYGQRIRFGISGSNLEISKTLEARDISHDLPLILSSDLESQKEEWIPEGNLRLFFAIEKLEDDAKTETLQKEQPKLGNENSENDCTEVFAQTEDEKTGVWNLQENLREILLNGNVSDVTLKVGEEEFKAHRCILAARSPVFLAMMMHNTKEKNTGSVDIQDVDPNTFSDFLNYLYTGSVKSITIQNVVNLYIAADKYQVNELRNVCTRYMLKNISVDNFCDILSLSLLHAEKQLTDACTDFFIQNSLAIVFTSKWQMFLGENPVVGNELYIKQLQLKK